MNLKKQNRAVVVVAAATCINLALGILYTWSIFKNSITQSIESGGAFNWDSASINDPYAVCCLVFAWTMIVGGKMQDKFGPRLTAIIGGILVGLGFIWISQTTSYIQWILGFGVLVGTGIAFAYGSATPPALKWHSPAKTGMITGIVVSGFGLASVYIAPLAQYLLNGWGLQQAMFFFGIAFLIIVCSFGSLLVNPPQGYTPPDQRERRSMSEENRNRRASFVDVNFTPSQVLHTPSFWTLWLLYFIGAGVGLMVVGNVAGMAKQSLGENAFLAVAMLAVGNAAGRIGAGLLSDKIGRRTTLSCVFGLQAVFMLLAVPIVSSSNSYLLVFLASCIGFNYGANLAIFPAIVKDYYGIKHFGMNYGMLFTAWGTGGFVLSIFSQSLVSKSGMFTTSFLSAAILLILGAVICFTLDATKAARRRSLGHAKFVAGSA